ncbi:shikimate kinase [Arthrobacter sp. MYb224]|uniref:shikimate kinase n=1 Tax=Arthrobacter sp. MYb224 TaxID=1848600 RepID=UPI000CFB15F5|nr:shikimate kinase [Arthrobacter sp. MYb224]PRA01167.1 shikimate kinase [Arthrobacter sp. MYb224]
MIYLIGPMASGKSTVGKALAKALGTDFADSDAHIVAAHGSIPQIFAEHDEAYFRDLEVAALAELRAGVIATGGGAVLREENQAVLRGGTVIYLAMTLGTAKRRLAGDTNRPLLAGDQSLTTWTRLYEARHDIYETLADLTLQVDNLSVAQLVEAIESHVIHSTR